MVKPPSDRSTGLVFTVVAILVAVMWRHNAAIVIAALTVAAVLVAVSLLAPQILRPFNLAWFRLGIALNRIVSPIVMLAIFVVAIVPFGLVMQRLSDPLRKKCRPEAKTYWIEQDTKGPPRR